MGKFGFSMGNLEIFHGKIGFSMGQLEIFYGKNGIFNGKMGILVPQFVVPRSVGACK